ncbi:MAG: hypothetical protein AAF714_12520 [Pseudomonadota bacterium]
MERRLILLALGCLFVIAVARICLGDVEVIALVPPGQEELAYFLKVEPTLASAVLTRLLLGALFVLTLTLMILAGHWAVLAWRAYGRR